MSSQPIIQLTDASTTREPDSIRVFIRDCRIELRVGIYESELQAPQTVVANVELEAALPHRYHDLTEKKLDRIIDYERVYNFLCTELPKMGHIYLLETMADQVIHFCFQDVRIQKVLVRLEKTGVFPAAAGAGIEVSRARPQKL